MTSRDSRLSGIGAALVIAGAMGCERGPAYPTPAELEALPTAQAALLRSELISEQDAVAELHRAQIDGLGQEEWVARVRLSSGEEQLLVLSAGRGERTEPMMKPLPLGEVPKGRGVLEFVNLTGDARQEIVVILGGSDEHARAHTFVWHWGEMRDRALDVPFHAEYVVVDVSLDGRDELVAWDTPGGTLSPRVFEFTGYMTERRVELARPEVARAVVEATWAHAFERGQASLPVELGALGAAMAWDEGSSIVDALEPAVAEDAKRAWAARQTWSPGPAPVIPERLELDAEHTRESAGSLVTLPGAWSDEQISALRAMAAAEGGLREREEVFLRDRFAGDMKQRRPDCAGWARALIALSAEKVASITDLSQTLVAEPSCTIVARDAFVRWTRDADGATWRRAGAHVHRKLLEQLAASGDRRVRSAASRALFVLGRGEQ